MKQWIAALALIAVGCQDLAVTDPNAPDRERATRTPTSTETFVSSAFRTWWPVAGHGNYPSWAFSTVAHDVTSGFADFGQLEISSEPRTAWNNSPVNTQNSVNQRPWYDLYSAISTVNDALIAIDGGLVIGDASRTARTQAAGKFMQGISQGYLGLYFDSAFVADEHVALNAVKAPQMLPYKQVVATAITELDASIAIAKANRFTFPPDAWVFTATDQDGLARLANSFAARLMVYSARTPAERAAVDWTEVIRRIDAGITTDFAPIAQPNVLWDDWQRLAARVRSGPPSDYGRPSYWLLGPADSSSGYLTWSNTPLNSRQPFQMVTKDRRIQGAGGPSTPGKYMGYNKSSIGAASRGTYRYSYYYYSRNGTGTSWQNGPTPDMTMAEMNLLKAEALIRLGRAAEAVPLINLTRVANGQLAPVTVSGPPVAPGCVPRKLDGTCGSLWDALRYEKGIENHGVNGVIAYFDARGWQTLPEFSLLHLPVPGRELATLQRPLYTYGGPGGLSSAPVPTPESCPVTLPGCP